MPELNLSSFTAVTDGFKSGDFLHIQRNVSGVWTDFRTNNYGLWGDDWQTAVMEVGIQSINSTPPLVSTTVGAGTLYIIGEAYAVWEPGSSNDNVGIEIRMTSFNNGGTSTHYGNLVASATANATPLLPPGGNLFYYGPDGITVRGFGGTTSNGSVRVYVKYIATQFGF